MSRSLLPPMQSARRAWNSAQPGMAAELPIVSVRRGKRGVNCSSIGRLRGRSWSSAASAQVAGSRPSVCRSETDLDDGTREMDRCEVNAPTDALCSG